MDATSGRFFGEAGYAGVAPERFVRYVLTVRNATQLRPPAMPG